MQIYLSIDDTDNLGTPGSGHLLHDLAITLEAMGLAVHCTGISRHQLFVHPAVPYTSHNSSMCITADTDKDRFAEIVQFAGRFVEKGSAPGSDPGLCLAAGNREELAGAGIIAFGLKAKREVCTKEEAYALAEQAGVHLSEHGGTGQGVVGALAAIGLRLHGSDGRFRGWLNLGKAGDIATRNALCEHPLVDDVVDEEGGTIPEDSQIIFAEDRIKTVFLNHRQVIPVTRNGKAGVWTTFTKSAVKRF